MIGMRIIISEKKIPTPNPNQNNLTTSSSSDSSSGSSSKADEEAAVWRVYSIVCSSLSGSGSGGRGSSEWTEDKTRFKDYVTQPKPSGYVRLSVCVCLSACLSPVLFISLPVSSLLTLFFPLYSFFSLLPSLFFLISFSSSLFIFLCPSSVPYSYQSLHMTLVHKESGIKMEVQIRSQRMHWEAEYGAAAHTKYKALLLPEVSSVRLQ